jgi:hypothetical protein
MTGHAWKSPLDLTAPMMREVAPLQAMDFSKMPGR